MVVSQPGMMGQVAGSQVRVDGVDERLRPAAGGQLLDPVSRSFIHTVNVDAASLLLF